MQRILIIAFLVALIHESQSHPLALFRITRDLSDPRAFEINETETDLILNNEEETAAAAQLFTAPRALVERRRPEAILIDIAYPGTHEDLVLAETQIFRPLFTYRKQVSRRQKLRKLAEK